MAAAAPFELPKAASEGFRDGTAYDAHRPSYTAEAVQSLLEKLRVAGKAGARIVELGSGTGKFTEVLARRPEGFEIVTVEPLASMRERLEAKGLPGVRVLDCHAADIRVEDEWGDACIVAQAFHWFATDEAVDEIARVLRPMAALGLIWNVDDYNKPRAWPASTRWEQELNDLVFSLEEDDLPRFRHAQWQDVFARPPPRFSLPLGEQRIPFTARLGSEALWERVNTLSQVAVLRGPARDEARRRFDEATLGGDVRRNGRGEIEAHGVTYLAWTDKVGGA